MFNRKTSNTGIEEDCNLLFECNIARIFQSMKVELRNKGKEYMDPHAETSVNSFRMAKDESIHPCFTRQCTRVVGLFPIPSAGICIVLLPAMQSGASIPQ